jgi:hypothetical protein
VRQKIGVFPVSRRYPCYKCAGPCWDRKPLTAPNGDKVLFSLCPTCWTPNDFVNGKAVQVMMVPVSELPRC